MATGRIKFFDEEKGFGFIVPDDGSEELFMHKSKIPSDIVSSIVPEARVSYEIGEHKGKKFTKDIAFLAPRPARPTVKFKPAPKPELDFEEEFEREWGLRRAK
jgi:CspA family cold shock protein